jgi:ribose transport system permease protein
VIGGTSLTGGRGGIKNTVIGLLVFGVLGNGLDEKSTPACKIRRFLL